MNFPAVTESIHFNERSNSYLSISNYIMRCRLYPSPLAAPLGPTRKRGRGELKILKCGENSPTIGARSILPPEKESDRHGRRKHGKNGNQEDPDRDD